MPCIAATATILITCLEYLIHLGPLAGQLRNQVGQGAPALHYEEVHADDQVYGTPGQCNRVGAEPKENSQIKHKVSPGGCTNLRKGLSW